MGATRKPGATLARPKTYQTVNVFMYLEAGRFHHSTTTPGCLRDICHARRFSK